MDHAEAIKNEDQLPLAVNIRGLNLAVVRLTTVQMTKLPL
jgi:hypothetical protein